MQSLSGKLRFRVSAGDGAQALASDRRKRLKQMLANLIASAREAASAGATVTLHAFSPEAG